MVIEGEIVVDRPIAEVFDFVADERNEPRFNPRMSRVQKITQGPIGRGTRFSAEMTSMGRPAAMIIEFTDYDRPRKLTSETRLSSMEIRGTLFFEPTAGGTLMRWRWDMRPRGLLKAIGPLIASLGRRQEETIWAGLKRCLEAGPLDSSH